MTKIDCKVVGHSADISVPSKPKYVVTLVSEMPGVDSTNLKIKITSESRFLLTMYPEGAKKTVEIKDPEQVTIDNTLPIRPRAEERKKSKDAGELDQSRLEPPA